VITASFVLSASAVSELPETGLPEIAMVGRSNVGKSSLINALVRKTVARTSAAPGKTRLANYYLVDLRSPIPDPRSPAGSFYLVDLPGYGYARGGVESAREFEMLTSRYFEAQRGSNRHLAGVLHLIDARHPRLPQDVAAHGWIFKTGLPIAVVATKMDKLKRAERAQTLKQLQEIYDVPVLAESALDHEGMTEIWNTIRQWLG
jgi:GTP-binding protein